MSDPEKVLCAQTLEQLEAMFAAEQAQVFIEKFGTELTTQLSELNDKRQNLDAVAKIAHKVIAVAGALGLNELASVSRQVMELAKDSTPISPAQWDGYQQAATRALIALATWTTERH